MPSLLSVIHAPVFGGAHNQLLALREPLAVRGWETVSLMPDEPGTGVPRLRGGGARVVQIELHRPRATLDPAVHLAFTAAVRGEIAALRRVIRRERVDLVQVHGPTNPHGAIAAHLEGIPVVWQVYDTRTPMVLRLATSPVVTGLADCVTTWGRELARVHPGLLGLGERLIPVFPPVDEPRFRATPQRRAAARKRLGVGDNALVVGAVGNLNPSKGHEHFVRAAARIRAVQPRAVFRVLGARSAVHDAYMAGVRGEATKLGLGDDAVLRFTDAGAQVADLLPGFDVLLSTSVPRSEGMPTAMLEAMVAGLPVVATRVGAVHELIANGVTGSVVAPEDPIGAADAVLRVLGDDARRHAMGAAGRERAVTTFGLERLADLHVHAFEVASEHRAQRGHRGRIALQRRSTAS